ncbi:MAG: Holliday junction resolvase RuvX [Clostridia bacterium]|nr:Holliday junction resolvase RuvX [Clostridia bacterium]
MGKIIAFDIGDKRIGVAVSDPFCEMALPDETYWRKGFEKDIDNLLKIAKDKFAETIVCGLPVNFDGSQSEQTVKTQEFINRLKEKSPLPVVVQDERFSTMQSQRILIEANVRRENRKKYVDSIAASFILEDYLRKIKLQGDKK